MGNSFSAGNALHVQLDRPYYNPGDQVTGHVLLNCVEPFKATTLALKVEGFEKTKWSERQHKDGVERDVEVSDSRDFFKLKVPLKSFNGQQVQPGQWAWPINFVLPANLPGSFEFKSGASWNTTHTIAKVRYRVKAECEVAGVLSHDIKFKAFVTVHQKPTKAVAEAVLRDVVHIKTCCCCDQGDATITARVQKDTYFPGETVVAHVEIENKSSKEFSEVQLQLCRTIQLKADSSSKALHDELAHITSPSVQPGESSTRTLSLTLPTALLPSTAGKLVSCKYTATIVLQAPLFTSNARVHVPITIYPAVPPNTTVAAPPPGWQPQIMPEVQVALPAPPPVPPTPQAMH